MVHCLEENVLSEKGVKKGVNVLKCAVKLPVCDVQTIWFMLTDERFEVQPELNEMPEEKTAETSFENETKDDIEIYAYPTNGFIPRSEIQVNEEWIDKYKVLMGKAYGERGSFPYWVLGKPKIAAPGTCCSETYLVVGPSNSHTETCNIAQYIQTRFFRFLVLLKKNTLNAPRGVYQFVPIQNFNEEWTDEKLYQKYNLTTDEIAFIESMVKPMDKDTVLSDNIDTDDE